MPSWSTHFKTEWTDLDTTGGTIWEAAHVLGRFLEESGVVGSEACGNRGRPKVLELGSGCGWLGILVALNCPQCDVVMTEQEAGGALAWTRHNLGCCGHALPNCSVAPLDWLTGNDAITSAPWDLVIGSDLVYNEAGSDMLPALLPKLLSRSSQREAPLFFYAHTRYRYEDLDMSFYRNLAANGLRVAEVWLEGEDSPPPSPRPMTEVFPTKRIAVFEVSSEPAQAPRGLYRRSEKRPTDVVLFDDSD
ncbi:hypothetical protein DIPPA_22221 [Diplonema papillatum]|nr:hypothetical protein DIPPA_22221 [Diplonema papillatum]